MRALAIFTLIVCINAYPFFGVSYMEKEVAEQRVCMIETQIEHLEDVRRNLLDALDASYEDLFNAGCSRARNHLKRVITKLRKSVVKVDKRIKKTRHIIKKVIKRLNPRARNEVIRNCKVERRLMHSHLF
ncbi:hypothetical protein EIN_186800 [Entamoeba invadens IP1]|uniref:hypothetical protein n=1 Tax=Entamoeba invadens IP1 TaxID=370355 RepID=UPI0002C3F36E|nr:hypothetical protein EIN_186800 [Entamoeba invadens IP1]ELP94243.1 hypothetical protein EIN_186800 [Entamoeba invadens IP1]|eukprot:XP_004261014.1 hypothetical protein EIN_186800 [Entamoeba invadens IP1]